MSKIYSMETWLTYRNENKNTTSWIQQSFPHNYNIVIMKVPLLEPLLFVAMNTIAQFIAVLYFSLLSEIRSIVFLLSCRLQIRHKQLHVTEITITFSAKVNILRWSTPPNCASTLRNSSSRALTKQDEQFSSIAP